MIQSSQILAQQAEVEIMFHQTEPLHVWGDEFKVEEVITNYVTNAIHYAKNEKKIDIRCTQENGVIRTSVFNTGDAIPEEELDKIWIKFYKVDKARTREYGGSGIGLSIVKAIMESMNQQCGVKNYDNGVEFWFTLILHCQEIRNKNSKTCFKTGVVTKVIYFFVISVTNVLYLTKRCKRKYVGGFL